MGVEQHGFWWLDSREGVSWSGRVACPRVLRMAFNERGQATLPNPELLVLGALFVVLIRVHPRKSAALFL